MKIKNKDLIPVIQFLNSLSFKGLKSIQRTNFTKKLTVKADEYINDQKSLGLEYKFSQVGLQEDSDELAEQENVIDETDNKVEISVIKEALKPLIAEDSEHEFSGSDGLAIACLYEALELDK